jgi:hypothetical protein
MDRHQLLAAEIYGYSYANYRDHLGIGNVRYEKLMPASARKLERAEAEGWSVEAVARELGVDQAEAATLLRAFLRARDVVDAENPADSFRWAVRQAVETAVAEGLRDEPSVERLATQSRSEEDAEQTLQPTGRAMDASASHDRLS